MTENDNIHPVVKLLAARMETHPDEFFYPENHAELRIGRWDFALREVRNWASPEELKLLSQGPLDALHRTVLDELLNGPERRAEEERLREEERKQYMAQALAAQRQTMPPGQFYSLSSQPSGGGWLKGLLGIK